MGQDAQHAGSSHVPHWAWSAWLPTSTCVTTQVAVCMGVHVLTLVDVHTSMHVPCWDAFRGLAPAVSNGCRKSMAGAVLWAALPDVARLASPKELLSCGSHLSTPFSDNTEHPQGLRIAGQQVCACGHRGKVACHAQGCEWVCTRQKYLPRYGEH